MILPWKSVLQCARPYFGPESWPIREEPLSGPYPDLMFLPKCVDDVEFERLKVDRMYILPLYSVYVRYESNVERSADSVWKLFANWIRVHRFHTVIENDRWFQLRSIPIKILNVVLTARWLQRVNWKKTSEDTRQWP